MNFHPYSTGHNLRIFFFDFQGIPLHQNILWEDSHEKLYLGETIHRVHPNKHKSFHQMNFSITVDTVKSGLSTVYVDRLQVIISNIYNYIPEDRLCLKLANSDIEPGMGPKFQNVFKGLISSRH